MAKFMAGLAGVLALISTAQAAPTKLQRIFGFETLNARLPYFESITGPAMYANTYNGIETRDYRVDGCRISAGIKDGNIRWLRLDLSPKCNFNLGTFIGNGYPTTAGLTVGRFARGSFGSDLRVQTPCLTSCGNAADPEVDFTWEGPHAVNYINVTLSVVLVSGPALAASTRWENIMRRREGESYVQDTKFNCVRTYDAEGIRAFADAPIKSVTIGYDLPNANYQRSCR